MHAETTMTMIILTIHHYTSCHTIHSSSHIHRIVIVLDQSYRKDFAYLQENDKRIVFADPGKWVSALDIWWSTSTQSSQITYLISYQGETRFSIQRFQPDITRCFSRLYSRLCSPSCLTRSCAICKSIHTPYTHDVNGCSTFSSP